MCSIYYFRRLLLTPSNRKYFYESNSEGISLVLLWRKIEEIVHVQIQHQPDKNDNGKCDKTCAVFHCCKEGQQEDPECSVIG